MAILLEITHNIHIHDGELELSAIRAQGSGGQNVNKVSSAIHLRFNIRASRLPDEYKQRLLVLRDSRITKDGVVIIKAQRFRDQEKNKQDALARLKVLIEKSMEVQKKRKPTKVSRTAKKKRVDSKVQRGRVKALRSKIID